MSSYLIIYRGGDKPNSPEEGAAHMAKFKAWVVGLGDVAINPGTPVGEVHSVSADGVSVGDDANPMTGFSVIEAADITAAIEVAKRCPYLDVGGCIEVREMKGMGGANTASQTET